MDLKTSLAASVLVVKPEGREFWMFTDATHVPYYRRNNGEGYSADLVLQRCRDGGTFIDIGAHHGYFSLFVATQRRQCAVMAFEPGPANYQVLRMNLRLNNALKVKAFDSAVSDQDEIKNFSLRDFSSHGSFYDDHISTVLDTVKVKAVSLDNMLKTTPGAPTVIKIDTEGHELRVLKGMAKLLTTSEEVAVLMEFNPIIMRKANQRPLELLFLIASFGFDVYFVDDERRQTCRIEEDRFNHWEEFIDRGNFQRGYFNILCLKKPEPSTSQSVIADYGEAAPEASPAVDIL